MRLGLACAERPACGVRPAWTFKEAGGAPEKLTYCTIWKHRADGSWKVLFDIGRPAE